MSASFIFATLSNTARFGTTTRPLSALGEGITVGEAFAAGVGELIAGVTAAAVEPPGVGRALIELSAKIARTVFAPCRGFFSRTIISLASGNGSSV